MSFLKTALAAVAAAYTKDVIVRPEQVARMARAYCDRVGKPLLNVGAGVPSKSLRTLFLGPTLWGDVNIDIAAERGVPHGRARVSYGDANDLCEWTDGCFGAVIASHVLEHLPRPDLALEEWRRVADKVFVVVPPWWAPHTWLHPGHKWYIDSSLKSAWPIWTDRRRIYLLPMSDKRYGARTWMENPSSLPLPSNQSPMPRSMSPTSHQSQSSNDTPLVERPDIESSSSVSTLMVLSGEKSDKS